MAAILTSASKRGGSNLTHLMYDSNTSYPQVTEFVELLTQRALITRVVIGDRGRYELTQKGAAYLKAYAAMAELIR